MAKNANPIVGRIPAEVHARAAAMGLIVETYSETIAGHGATGRIAWTVSRIVEVGEWTDAVRLRYGSDSSHEHARASLRNALDQLATQLTTS